MNWGTAMSRGILIVTCAVLASCFLLASCSDDESPTSVGSGSFVTEVSVDPPLISFGDEVTVVISWTNESEELITLYFESYKFNDFVVLDGETEVARHTGVYDAVNGEYRLAPGMNRVHTYTFVFDPDQSSEIVSWQVAGDELNAGSYSVQGGIFGYESEFPWEMAGLRVSE
jgi:hypothetical protein